ncbi:MAG: hypothetical protein JW809_00700 [Pirellulales bacterium]|nr:hypothetical protein [Pirellulales bacterium]
MAPPSGGGWKEELAGLRPTAVRGTILAVGRSLEADGNGKRHLASSFRFDSPCFFQKGRNMTKVATVHSQQMWEYLALNRKTEEFLINELNELGKQGWELVGASFNKDLKGVAASFSWTAILKRPLVAVAPAASAPAGHPAAAPHEPPSSASAIEDIFDVRPA